MPRSVSYPFPVLGHEDDVLVHPEAEASVEVRDGRAVIQVDVDGLPDEYQDALRSGSMGLAVRVECPRTYLRETLLFQEDAGELEIAVQDLAGPVKAEILLVARDWIPAFRCSAMNRDYDGVEFPLPAGAICGRLSRFSFEVPDTLTGGKGTGSLVRIKKDAAHTGPMDIFLESDRILLTVGQEEWDGYQACKTLVPDALVASIVFPALVYALEPVVRPDGSESGFEGFLWFDRLREWVASDRVPEEAREDPFLAAQHLLRMPVGSAIKNLVRITSEEE